MMAFVAMLVGIYFSLCMAQTLKNRKIILFDFIALVGQDSLWILIGQSVIYKVIGIILEGSLNEIIIKIIQVFVAVIIPLGCACIYKYMEMLTNKIILKFNMKLKFLFENNN